MITWITGNTGAGKTTLANNIIAESTTPIVHLDGDMMRRVWKIGLSKEDRIEHNLRIARLAVELELQGFDVIISTICPYISLRDEVQKITGCTFTYLTGGKEPSDEYPYER